MCVRVSCCLCPFQAKKTTILRNPQKAENATATFPPDQLLHASWRVTKWVCLKENHKQNHVSWVSSKRQTPKNETFGQITKQTPSWEQGNLPRMFTRELVSVPVGELAVRILPSCVALPKSRDLTLRRSTGCSTPLGKRSVYPLAMCVFPKRLSGAIRSHQRPAMTRWLIFPRWALLK